MSYDKKAELLTGPKFLNVISRRGFLSNGHTTASFQLLEVVELWIGDLILLADRILNADNDGVDRVKPSAGVDAETGKSVISASICLWIVTIFDTKYFPTSFAKVGACRFEPFRQGLLERGFC